MDERWAIVEDGGVSDRFRTEQDARDALTAGGYSPGAAVEYVPDEFPALSD